MLGRGRLSHVIPDKIPSDIIPQVKMPVLYVHVMVNYGEFCAGERDVDHRLMASCLCYTKTKSSPVIYTHVEQVVIVIKDVGLSRGRVAGD